MGVGVCGEILGCSFVFCSILWVDIVVSFFGIWLGGFWGFF